MSEESVRNKVEREYPGAAILKIESGQARDQEKLPSQLNQEPLMAAIGQFNASVGSDSNNGSKSVSNSEDLQTGAALSGKGPGTVSSGSSERNPPKREQISGVGNRQDASSGDDNDTRKSGLFSEWVQPTQPLYQDTVLPKSFELSAGQQKIWVHGNATEHLAEYAWGMLRRGVSPDLVNMATSIQLQSLRSAVEAVTTTGVPYNTMLYSGGETEIRSGQEIRTDASSLSRKTR
ncbi:MAG TPA: hypothetical protein VMF06_06935 [Candidatus Limnocylindria bacterium]|nr:hypothetical protein [Candidatus Limnocylindria bacterium]